MPMTQRILSQPGNIPRIPERRPVATSRAGTEVRVIGLGVPKVATITGIGAALLTNWAAALVALGLIRSLRVPPAWAWLVALPLLMCPRWIPAEAVAARGLTCLVCADAWFRVIDLSRVLQKTPLTWQTCIRFLVPWPFLLTVFEAWNSVPRVSPRTVRGLRLIVALLTGVGVAALLWGAASSPVLRDSFLLDHCLKVALFVIAVEAGSAALQEIERLTGLDAPPMMRSIWKSRSVGEFWSRYNTRVHDWLAKNVFQPVSDAGRDPRYGLIGVFLVSAAFHEFAFGIATEVFDGTQFLFFALQAPGVALTGWLARKRILSAGWKRLLCHAATIVWFTATSVLFFHNAARVFPIIYANPWWISS